MKYFLNLLLLLVAVLFLESCRQLPPSSSTRSDSSIIIRESVPVHYKGGQTSKEVNLEDLRKLYGAGTIERYYSVSKKDGNASLEQRIDLLTGQIYAQCTARDSLFNLMKETREHYRKENKTILLPAEKPNAWQQLISWFNTKLTVILIALIAILVLRRLVLWILVKQ